MQKEQRSTWFQSDRTVAWMLQRSLEADFATLRPYLSRGLHVLDVGCGAGTITLDVAALVRPGAVVGVDITERQIEAARAEAETRRADNVQFLVGDAYNLEFDAGRFDVVYSHALIGWLREPLRALKEQMRVTRKGGWVVTTYPDVGATMIWPPCPAFERFYALSRNMADPKSPDAFINQFIGRELFALYCQAGLLDIRMSGNLDEHEMCYAGSHQFERRYDMVKANILNPETGISGWLKKHGLFDAALLEEAQREWEAWHVHPHAFYMHAAVVAAGRV